VTTLTLVLRQSKLEADGNATHEEARLGAFHRSQTLAMLVDSSYVGSRKSH
jgi:hypothetical protein